MTLSLFGKPEAPAHHHIAALASFDFDTVRDGLAFSQATTTMYGRTFDVPRLEAWYGLNPYTYGGQTQQPKPWPDLLHAICNAVEGRLNPTSVARQERAFVAFDSCFANLYRDGQDTIGWHADDDRWIGPWIASVSFGATRDFVMRRKDDRSQEVSFSLGHGDLLVMPPGTQERWEHHVPRRKGVTSPRINLTFRQTLGAHPLAKGPKGRGVQS